MRYSDGSNLLIAYAESVTVYGFTLCLATISGRGKFAASKELGVAWLATLEEWG